MLMNKTAIECWNILKCEIESTIDKFVPLRNKENGLERNTFQNELLKKIVFKQTMWRVYRRTRKDEDNANYKEAHNLATHEIRKSKRTFEKTLAGNITRKQQWKHNFRWVSNGRGPE